MTSGGPERGWTLDGNGRTGADWSKCLSAFQDRLPRVPHKRTAHGLSIQASRPRRGPPVHFLCCVRRKGRARIGPARPRACPAADADRRPVRRRPRRRRVYIVPGSQAARCEARDAQVLGSPGLTGSFSLHARSRQDCPARRVPQSARGRPGVHIRRRRSKVCACSGDRPAMVRTLCSRACAYQRCASAHSVSIPPLPSSGAQATKQRAGAAAKGKAAKPAPLSEEQQQEIREAFDLFDADGSGTWRDGGRVCIKPNLNLT